MAWDEAIRALSQLIGDEVNLARAAFRNCTPEQMKVLREYEEHAAKIKAAIDWVKAQRD